MFKLVNIIRETTLSSDLQCQVIGYQDGTHADTEIFADVVDCIKWATGNAHHFSKFEIYNEKWKDHKIVGVVSDRKIINWSDQPI